MSNSNEGDVIGTKIEECEQKDDKAIKDDDEDYNRLYNLNGRKTKHKDSDYLYINSPSNKTPNPFQPPPVPEDIIAKCRK